MIDAELRLFLLEYPGVTNLVASRIYPSVLPEDATLPAVVLLQVSDVPSDSNSGSNHTAVRYQVDSYAESLTVARLLDQNIRAVLKGKRSRMGQYTAVSFLSNTSSYPLVDEGEWRISSDYVIQLTS